MNKTVIVAMMLLIGSIFASSVFAYEDTRAASAVATKAVAVKATGVAVSPTSIAPPKEDGYLGWIGTMRAGEDTYRFYFSTAKLIPSASNGITEKMIVGVATLYDKQGKASLYKIVNNPQAAPGIVGFYILDIGASFKNVADAKAQGIGFFSYKLRTIDKAEGLFFLNKGDDSPNVGRILTGKFTRGSSDKPVVTTKSVDAQSIKDVKVTTKSVAATEVKPNGIRAFFAKWILGQPATN